MKPIIRQLATRAVVIASIVVSGAVAAQQPNCSAVPQAIPMAEGMMGPAAELVPIQSGLGSPAGVLSQAYNEVVTADRVVMRIQVETCLRIAMTMPPASPANPNDPAAYKPQTQWDNTPWRFNMDKNMTAAEFEAWMKAKGIRVAKGAPVVPPPASTEAPVAGEAQNAQPVQPQPAQPGKP